MTSITAILPAFNECVSIGSIVLCTRKYADRVLVIDDGSTDRTAEVAELAGAEVIKHPANQGKGAVLRTGFKAAGGADIIITMDTDGQHSHTLYWRTPYVRVTFSSRMQHDLAEIPKLVDMDSNNYGL
jgi:glycosyltransferase involved in cell wall biosynthesis